MITFVDAAGNTFPIDADASIEIENIKAILEADTGIPAESQSLRYRDQELDDASRTLESYGVVDGELLVVSDTRKATVTASSTPTQSEEAAAAELLRQQLLQNRSFFTELAKGNPALARAAEQSPESFFDVLQKQRAQMANAAELSMSDPFDIEAQKKIEEAIRQERVAENLVHAIEYNPESFANVTMLYVNLKVNGHPIKAFVDSGAQATIISPECAERCG
ncbi:DNA damage-inducible protein 1 [Malassezia cuniculi]|uniref:DNA damage-inducible protein 1 n=1 Tax=Malassezia cuniculi TaxID=948313 RepID=A0AAF0J6B6_9BASI|nr:DNA damage-inducible protein 1 [Malassezia cuniculi]